MLKKIGAISPPRTTPPRRLFGTKGMSSPMCHMTELQADFRDEPVPTTSPTKTTRGCPRPEPADRGDPAREPGLSHGQGVQGDVGPRRGVLGRRKIIRIDFAVDLENGQGRGGSGKAGRRQEPLALGPGLHDGPGARVRGREGHDLFERPVDQDGPFQGFGRGFRPRPDLRETRRAGSTLYPPSIVPSRTTASFRETTGEEASPAADPGQPFGFDLGRRIDARGNPVPQKAEEQGFLPGGGCFEKPADFVRLGRGSGEARGFPSFRSFLFLLKIRFQHDHTPFVGSSVFAEIRM